MRAWWLGLAFGLLAACGSRALTDDGAGAGGAGGRAGAGASGTGGAVSTGGASGAAGTTVPAAFVIPAGAITHVAAVLWRQEPDAGLVAQAARLSSASGFADLVRAMLADPRATIGVGAFYRWWLDLDDVATTTKDPTLFPEFSPALAADMANETTRFGVEVTLTMNDSFRTLMTAPFSFLNERLATIYGVPGVVGDDLRRVDLPPQQRAGLLTQPALQVLGSFATRNSPSHRGAQIDRALFCLEVPLPPPGLPPVNLTPPAETLRQALAVDTDEASCSACHKVFDPPGFAFEGFDAIGRARAEDDGVPVDTSALQIEVPTMAGNAGDLAVQAVDGPVALATLLAGAPAAQDCFARQWLRFALGRELTANDEPSVAKIDAAFAPSGNLRELVVAVLTSDVFLSP
ncbi:MAG TPA: DUF1592 domain-containing protein [Polyangia bacterium]|nr:DUF1592 domain-containing protein [Polyangia bacterium]